MKKLLLIVSCVVAVVLTPPASAQDTNGISTNSTPDLPSLVQAIQKKIDAGSRSETDYSNELNQFDALIAASKNNPDPEAAAHAIYMKAILYLQIFDNLKVASDLLNQLKDNYGNTRFGTNAVMLLARISDPGPDLANQSNLKVGEPFPDFAETNLEGNPISVGALKGKVVLLDFWATWCGPCQIELPNVIATYKKHHGEGMEVIGISLDDDRKALDEFLKKQKSRGMTWPQYYDGLGWSNKLVKKYEVAGVPFSVLIGRDGKVIGKSLRGEELEKAVTEALASK